MKANLQATRRLELAAKGKISHDLDPALGIPSLKFDNWENATTGFGQTTQHATNNTSYQALGKISDDELESMYRSDWVASKIVDAPAEDMTRNGISYQHNDDDEDLKKKVEDFDDLLVEDFDMWQLAFQAIALARVSGGSLTFFHFDDIEKIDELKDPLNINRINEIKWVRVIPSWYAIPLTYYRDINDPKWGQPEHYQIVIREAGFGVTLNVHESRMIRYDGKFTTQKPRVQNRGWNDSIIQSVYTALRDYGVCVTESTSTLESFTQDYLGMKGLSEAVMNNATDVVLDRIFLSHLKMNSNKLSIYDSESEAMERKGTPITGLADLWDRYSEAICGASGIPRSRFFSSESGALGGNAAESDTRNYFNRIHSMQEKDLRKYLNRFMSTVNLAVKMLEEIPRYSFNDLREQSDKEKAETKNIQAQTDQIYLQENVVTPEEVAYSRFSKDTTDLETMNLDFEAREELEKEQNNEELEALQEQIAAMSQAQLPPEQPIEEPEEKQDSQPIIIEHKPQITVESPTVNVEIPEQKDHTDSIESLKKSIEDVNKKLDEEIDIED